MRQSGGGLQLKSKAAAAAAAAAARPEMVTPSAQGADRGLQADRVTLRGQASAGPSTSCAGGGCYKHTFYGITSYQCMEATPSLACANKCVFCWRHHKNPSVVS